MRQWRLRLLITRSNKEMIFSTLHSKDTNEDPKTSSIIGGLLLLPDQIFYKIVNRACAPNILPINNGSIFSFEFWPHWYDGTYNANFVEPDVIIHCEFRDIIIEAKYSETSGQYREQWVKEIGAYRKRYGCKKEVSFIALGGNENYDSEEVDGVKVLKCSWTSLLMAVSSIKSQFEKISYSDEHVTQTIRILKYIEKSFEAHQVYSLSTLDNNALTRFHSYSDNLLLKFKI